MKIIKPIKIGDGMIESSAPPDGFTEWEIIGRDNEFSGSQVTTAGDVAYVARSNQPYIDIYGLSTASKTGEIPVSKAVVETVSASPDGSFLAYVERDSFSPFNYRLRVLDLLTSQTVYSTPIFEDTPYRALSWSSNSSFFGFLKPTVGGSGSVRALILSSGLWGSESESSNLLDELPVSNRQSYQAGSMAIDTTGNSYVALSASNGSSSAGGVLKLSSSATVTANGFVSGSQFMRGVILNELRSEVGVYGSSPGAYFNASSMASVSAPANLTGYSIFSAVLSPDGAELSLRSSSVQPYIRRFSAADYSSLPSYPVDSASIPLYSQSYCLLISGASYTPINLTTNTVEEGTNPTVTTGDIYIYSDQVYKALTDNNDRPDSGAAGYLAPDGETMVFTWQDQGPINRLRMFDGKLDTLTTAPDQLVVDITPNAIVNSMALFNVNASTVSIVMTDQTDGIVYDSGEISTRDSSQITGWYQFFFGARGMKSDFARLDLPPYRNATITLTLNGEGSDVSIGEAVLGRYQTIGIAQYGTSVGIIDFSRKEADIFGNFEILERRFSKRAEYDIKIPTAQNGYVQTELAKLRVTPLVWIGDETKEETVIYGYYRNFEILLEGPSLSDGTITVEGL